MHGRVKRRGHESLKDWYPVILLAVVFVSLSLYSSIVLGIASNDGQVASILAAAGVEAPAKPAIYTTTTTTRSKTVTPLTQGFSSTPDAATPGSVPEVAEDETGGNEATSDSDSESLSASLSEKETLGAVVLLAPARNAGTWWNDITRFCFLMRSVRSIDQHLNSHYGPYPIHILIAKDYTDSPSKQDGPYTEKDKALIKSWAPNSTVIFEEIDMYSGDALEPETTTEQIIRWRNGEDGAVEGRDLGYTSMCRLWSGRLQTMDFLKPYRYYMRLDDDSLFVDKLPFDPFDEMRQKDLWYVWRRDAFDHWGVSQLFQVISRHVKLRRGLPFVSDNGADFTRQGQQPYNNFHMASVDFWSTPQWQAFWKDMNREHLFFKHRVGDANVHAAAVMMAYEMAGGNDKHYQKWGNLPYAHNTNDMPNGWGELAWRQECEAAEEDQNN